MSMDAAPANYDSDLLIAALIAKLGGEVLITRVDLENAELMEVQRSDSDLWDGSIRFRTRHAPITIQGELSDDRLEIEAGRLDGTR